MNLIVKLLILSDLHFGGGNGEEEAAEELKNFILTVYDPQETAVCLTGDLTENASPAEVAAVKAFIASLELAGFLVLRVPGNHDKGFKGFMRQRDRIAHWQSEIHPAPYPRELMWNGWRFLLLDSCADNGPGALAQGTLGSDQLAWLKVVLSYDFPTVILMHHKPWWSVPTLRLTDANKFLSITNNARCRLVVVCGHRHYHAVWHGRDGVVLAVSAGKCTEKKREPTRGLGKLAFWKRRTFWYEFEEITLGADLSCKIVRLE